MDPPTPMKETVMLFLSAEVRRVYFVYFLDDFTKLSLSQSATQQSREKIDKQKDNKLRGKKPQLRMEHKYYYILLKFCLIMPTDRQKKDKQTNSFFHTELTSIFLLAHHQRTLLHLLRNSEATSYAYCVTHLSLLPRSHFKYYDKDIPIPIPTSPGY